MKNSVKFKFLSLTIFLAVGTNSLSNVNIAVPNISPSIGLINIAPTINYGGIYYLDTSENNPNIQHDNSETSGTDLIIGTEIAKNKNNKEIRISNDTEVGEKILEKANKVVEEAGVNGNVRVYTSSLTWFSTVGFDPIGTIKDIYLVKIPYTAFAGEKTSKEIYNFLDYLENRYGALDQTKEEREFFNNLNNIGKSEIFLFDFEIDKAFRKYRLQNKNDARIYVNTKQRIHNTSSILDKEITMLKNDSKEINKFKIFGRNEKNKTISTNDYDYSNNAYGLAYVHEDENVKSGKNIGYYAGIVENKIRFKDDLGSKENILQGKVGVFKNIPFSNLNWTISGDLIFGYNKIQRKYSYADETYTAKARYRTYGLGLKNELSKEFNINNNFSIKPYISLKMEYQKIGRIKEDSEEIEISSYALGKERGLELKVKNNNYLSVKPEIGTEFAFNYKSFRAGLGLAYENELNSSLNNEKNQVRLRDIDNNWYEIKAGRKNRKGNLKTDLRLGLDIANFGITGDVGYDTNTHNVRGGIGFKVAF